MASEILKYSTEVFKCQSLLVRGCFEKLLFLSRSVLLLPQIKCARLPFRREILWQL